MTDKETQLSIQLLKKTETNEITWCLHNNSPFLSERCQDRICYKTHIETKNKIHNIFVYTDFMNLVHVAIASDTGSIIWTSEKNIQELNILEQKLFNTFFYTRYSDEEISKILDDLLE